MANKLIVFEDDTFSNFYPLTLNRPVFFLRCGAYQLWEKIAKKMKGYSVSFSCREELASVAKNETGIEANQIKPEPNDKFVFINARLRLENKQADVLNICRENTIYRKGNTVAAIVLIEPPSNLDLKSFRFNEDYIIEKLGIKADVIEGDFQFYDYLWNLVDCNCGEIISDYSDYFSDKTGGAVIKPGARIISDNNIHLADGSELGENCVIDNRHGPVIIDRNAKIGPLSYIEGPCYVGRGTHVFRANIREGCSFGPVCRVGGEVEESIFQGYTNKYHDGFMGHAYLGSWVNLGAMTTNSDLKNNYKPISVVVNGKNINSGSIKVGSFIGDHTKTGIGTLFNTGISIGFSCNLYGGTLITSPEVPSFSWGNEAGYNLYRLDKAIETARITMSRRDAKLTENDEQVFSLIYKQAIEVRKNA